MTPRLANLLTAVGLAGLLAAVGLSAPRWAALLRAPAASPEAEEIAADEAAPPAAEGGETGAGRRISVRLYFEAPDREGLLSEERDVAFSSDLARQVRTVVEEMAKGSTTGLVATLPAGTRVLEVFVQARGVAFVDLSSEVASGLPGGSKAELLTVYSVVNTIVTNFPAVRRVRLLVDDQPVASLGGHVDVSRPLPPDMTLLALPSPSPAPAPAEPAAASPSPGR
jgi:spore germination protein GerM